MYSFLHAELSTTNVPHNSKKIPIVFSKTGGIRTPDGLINSQLPYLLATCQWCTRQGLNLPCSKERQFYRLLAVHPDHHVRKLVSPAVPSYPPSWAVIYFCPSASQLL